MPPGYDFEVCVSLSYNMCELGRVRTQTHSNAYKSLFARALYKTTYYFWIMIQHDQQVPPFNVSPPDVKKESESYWQQPTDNQLLRVACLMFSRWRLFDFVR